MNSGEVARDNTELERLYAQARRYDLLSREQEQEIDERKWSAVRRLLELMVEDRFSRHYLGRWITNCSRPLPDIENFKRREHRSLLRRELADYLPGGCHAKKLKHLAESCTADIPQEALLTGLLELSLPASLVVGMAEAVMKKGGGAGGSKVAVALKAWERHWLPDHADDLKEQPLADARQMAEQIKLYTTARDLLIMHNLRLVYSIAGRNSNGGAPFLDLVQEGTLGLLRAAEKFRFERGYRFSTYAFNWITQGVKRHLADAAGTIRYPTHIQEQLGRLYGERGGRLARSGSAPLDTELADALDMPVTKARELLQLRNFGVSLDAPRFDEDAGSTLLDGMAGGPFAEPGDEAEQASLNQRLLSEIRRLDLAEQQVVVQRWGLLEGCPLTRAEIADQMSVSREWVRQLEQSALNKLAHSEMMRSVYKDHYSAKEQYYE
jgi:RNA polymerase sigma factor (sigma-70 family)